VENDTKETGMSTVRGSIDLAVPVHTAYQGLCQFENYPQFMQGVQQITQVAPDTTHWVMDIGGATTEFDARIIERPDELVAWESVGTLPLSERLTLQQLPHGQCRVNAEFSLDAQAYMPTAEYGEDMLKRRLKADLAGFKQYIESSPAGAADSGTPAASRLDAGDGVTPGAAHGFGALPDVGRQL
jgi:uncharacterized membrane protein